MNEKKLAYNKPDIEFVDFTLSSSIATNCVDIANYSDINACELITEAGAELPLFSDSNTDCMLKDNCYHNPDSTYVLFSS